MQNFHNDLQMLGLDQFHVGEVNSIDPLSQQNMNDLRRVLLVRRMRRFSLWRIPVWRVPLRRLPMWWFRFRWFWIGSWSWFKLLWLF